MRERKLGTTAAIAGALVAAGLVTADGFDSLRALIDPRRKTVFQGPLKNVRRPRTTAGRWALLNPPATEPEISAAARRELEIESASAMLLRRYGVVFRDLLERETTVPPWRELLGIFRRLEARGTVRGGRFITGFGGEQFALPEAVESLRAMRRGNGRNEGRDEPRREGATGSDGPVTVAAADPLNLVGIVIPGERAAAVPGKTVTFYGGAVWTPEPSLAASAI